MGIQSVLALQDKSAGVLGVCCKVEMDITDVDWNVA